MGDVKQMPAPPDSAPVSRLAQALSRAQGEMSGAKKDSANPFFHSKYADLASVWDACRGPFARHGLSVIQKPSCRFVGEPEPYSWKSKSGEERYGVRVATEVIVVTVLKHESGESEEDTLSCMLAVGDPQAVGSAITYLRRYGLQAMAGIAPEDDDGEMAMSRGPSIPRREERTPAATQDPDMAEFMKAAQVRWSGKGFPSKKVGEHVQRLIVSANGDKAAVLDAIANGSDPE